ncbi:MAG: hypothetical protein WCA32_21555 [Chromatiaceae bacterium]
MATESRLREGQDMYSALQPERRNFGRVPFDAAVRAEPIPPPSRYRVLHLLSEDLTKGFQARLLRVPGGGLARAP